MFFTFLFANIFLYLDLRSLGNTQKKAASKQHFPLGQQQTGLGEWLTFFKKKAGINIGGKSSRLGAKNLIWTFWEENELHCESIVMKSKASSFCNEKKNVETIFVIVRNEDDLFL